MISRLTSRTNLSKKANANRKARIVGFMSAKGGDGGTCVAANIATAIAQNDQKKILVIDLSFPFGDIEMFLTNQKQENDLADFSDEISRLDSDLMDSMVTHITNNLDLIPAPISVDRLINIKVEHIDKIIEISSSNYDFVMIDIGAGIDPISIHALGELNELIVVATMTVPSVKRATQVLRYWSGLGLDGSKVSLVVNRYYSRSDIKIADIEKAMNRKVKYYLPQDDAGVQESLLKGTPLINLRPKSDFSKAILDWASDWSGKEKGKTLWQRLKTK
jgi:pilus assembly protein CpaE